MLGVEYPDSNVRSNKSFAYLNTSFGLGLCDWSKAGRRVIAPPSGSTESKDCLRQCATYVRVQAFLGRRLNDKDDVILGFEGGDDGSIARLIRYGFAIDCSDDSSFAEANLVCERARPNIRDHDSALDANLGGQ